MLSSTEPFWSAASPFHFDPQGSVAERVTSGGTVSASLMKDAYGATASTASAGDPFGYEAQAGYYTDGSKNIASCKDNLSIVRQHSTPQVKLEEFC